MSMPPAVVNLLDQILAKSAGRTPNGSGRPERLTEHSLTTRAAGCAVAERIGDLALFAQVPKFWMLVEYACLLHDAGKVAEGFQHQVRNPGYSWGERHEILSLAYVQLLTEHLTSAERILVATGAGLHHRWLTSPGGQRDLRSMYPSHAAWERKFGYDPHPPAGQPYQRQVPLSRHRALLYWFAAQLGLAVPGDGDRKLWQRAQEQFAELRAAWETEVDAKIGLRAVLLQGAVTLADHSASADVRLQTHLPLPLDYLGTLPYKPYPHQQVAAGVQGHLILIAPTGQGKTEAGLAWASAQLPAMPGRPRVAWILPYRASINAAAATFTDSPALQPAPGEEKPDIGILHGAAALSILADAAEDCQATASDAHLANARAGAMRLFTQRMRVATAYQLLIGAIAGPKYSSVLLEQANTLTILDELHAYDPETFGRICATMGLWEELGSRTAILSATLAPPMIELIKESLHQPVTVHQAPPGTAPARHRLVLDERPLSAPASLDLVRAWLHAGYSVLLVANTVATAQYLYRQLAPAARDAVPHLQRDAAILLHSRFRGRDRTAIERRIKARHRERRPGDPTCRGGLVVATQAVEVSLRLDFDRGATELAHIESVAQRAGRVNRLGLHPEGVVEYRVHRGESTHPYEPGALDAAWNALHAAPGPIISEQTIDTWLGLAYQTPWGKQWEQRARHARDEFAATFLTFTDPFGDREQFADKLQEKFDTIEVLLEADRAEYQRLTTGSDAHALLGADLLIPVTYRQWKKLRSTGIVARYIPVVDAPYNKETGLDLGDRRTIPTFEETVL